MSDARARLRGAQLSAGSVLVAVFIAGALVGAALTYFLDADTPTAEAATTATPQVMARPAVLYRQLGLSLQQRRQINRIMARDRVKAARLFQEIQPRLRARYDSTTADIRGVMTPEQQQRFDELRLAERARILQQVGPGRLPLRVLRRLQLRRPPPPAASPNGP